MAGQPYSDRLWGQMLENNLSELAELAEIDAISHGYVDDFPNFNLNVKGRGWETRGYERIQFRLNCPAVMHCDPQGRRSPYLLGERDRIEIKNIHTMQIYFPRGYPEDHVQWAVFFVSEAPMYANIARMTDQGLMEFSLTPPRGGVNMPGAVCLGPATVSSSLKEILEALITYLRFEDRDQHTTTMGGGRNDMGYDTQLFDHTLMNFDRLRDAINAFGPQETIEWGQPSPKSDTIVW